MQTHQITFKNQVITCIEHHNELFVAMKPVVEGMGLNWKPQHRKLITNTERYGITIMVIPSYGGNQETLCMPLNRLFGWMMTIHPSKVKPELRDNIIAYQAECDRVLAKHFAHELHAEANAAQHALNTTLQGLFKKHPQWPTILQGKVNGDSLFYICLATGFKATSTICRNLRRMRELGITPAQQNNWLHFNA